MRPRWDSDIGGICVEWAPTDVAFVLLKKPVGATQGEREKTFVELNSSLRGIRNTKSRQTKHVKCHEAEIKM